MVKSGEKINKIVIQKKLKSGGFGSVFLGQEEGTGKSWAIKVMNAENESVKKAIEAEISVGLSLRAKNPFLVQYREVLMVEDECLLVMEYFPDGDLFALFEKRKEKNLPFSQTETLSFLFQVCTGLKSLHDKKIVHRDLKPQNILISNGKVFIISDYSICRRIDSTNTLTMVTSSGYTAPELLCGADNLTGAVDVYSIGCIFFQLLSLKHPFCNSNGSLNLGSVMAGKINPLQTAIESPAIQSLALAMLDVDPSKRPSVDTILAHPAVSGFVLADYARFLFDEQAVERDRAQLREMQLEKEKKQFQLEREEKRLQPLMLCEKADVINHPDYPDSVEIHGHIIKVKKYSKDYSGAAFAVINKIMTNGIFRLACKGGSCTIGLSTLTGDLEDHHFTPQNWFNMDLSIGRLSQNRTYLYGNNPVGDSDIASVEVDMNKHTVHLFINGLLQPMSLLNVPSSLVLYLVISEIGREVEIISFEQLKSSSVTESTPVAPVCSPEKNGSTSKTLEWKE